MTPEQYNEAKAILTATPEGCNGMGQVRGDSKWVPMHNTMGVIRSTGDIKMLVEMYEREQAYRRMIREAEGILEREHDECIYEAISVLESSVSEFKATPEDKDNDNTN